MDDKDYMMLAIDQAKTAALKDEVPVGAIVVDWSDQLNPKIISSAYNLRETKQSPSAHAEFIAIEQAAKILNTWRLESCCVYVTLEPCIMCAGLLHQCRIKRCVFGAYDLKAGALFSLYEIHQDSRLNHNFEVTGGVLEKECAGLLKEFFKKKR